MFGAQLSACGRNIMALLTADCHVHAMVGQDTLKFKNIIAGSPHVLALRHMVNRNQVDVAQHRLKNAGQFLGMLGLVINPADKSIFKADAAACLGLIVTQ